MLNANFITRGIGPGSDIAHLILSGLSPTGIIAGMEDLAASDIIITSATELITFKDVTQRITFRSTTGKITFK